MHLCCPPSHALFRRLCIADFISGMVDAHNFGIATGQCGQNSVLLPLVLWARPCKSPELMFMP